jgi:phospholipid-binding lipoprotein MlaA
MIFKTGMFNIAIRIHVLLVIMCLFSACAPGKHTQSGLQEPTRMEKTPAEPATLPEQQSAEVVIPGLDDMQDSPVADPFEPWNRAMFTFNDKLYFWAMKPVIKGYNWVVPEDARKSARNFFYNLEMPDRFISSVLQAEIKAAGIELARFTINSTMGVVGLFDVAKSMFQLEPQTKDIGQTLGKYGIGEGFYLVWPFVGPSTARDTIGTASDMYLSPWLHVNIAEAAAALGGFDYFNRSSLDSSEYEELVNSSVEPYAALKNAYIQYRRNIVKNK